MRIAIIDYGMGNIRSVQKACEYLGHQAKLIHLPAELEAADHVILPGVGAFSDAMKSIQLTNLDQAIVNYVQTGKPLLGICLGMQLFFQSSNEGNQTTNFTPGLALLPGSVTRFPANLSVKVPHIGWNEVEAKQSKLFAGLPNKFSTYFVHSYQVDPQTTPYSVGITHHGKEFVCAVEHNNLMATQFHPEKSGAIGLKILENFLK